MRLRKADLRQRVNGELTLRFRRSGLTSYAGLELMGRFFSVIELRARIRRTLDRVAPSRDYPSASLTLLLLVLIIVGGRRVRHILYVSDDPIVARICGLSRLPSPRSVGRWLTAMAWSQLCAFVHLNEDIVAEAVHRANPARLTIDVDGTVVSTGLQVEGAERGFNPHQRKKPSYYPISAYEAQTGQILRVENRPGNIHDGKASLGFLGELFDQIDRTIGTGRCEEYRMDGAFFRRDVIELLEARGAEYAIKVPFFQWIGLKNLILETTHWTTVDTNVSCFERVLQLGPWGRRMRVVVYRRRVRHESPKNYQLDLFDPSNGHFEYSATATNKSISGRALWHFINGRGTHEKVYGELKNGFAFDSVPTQSYYGNSVWQLLSILAFNLTHAFQAITTAPERRTNRKRTCRFVFDSITTLRYQLLHRAGVLARPDGRPVLDIGPNPHVRDRFETVADMLCHAA